MSHNLLIGSAGEDIACGYLGGKDYKILERNFRTSFGEIDIITLSPHKTLTFFEIKTMVSSSDFNNSIPKSYPHFSGTFPDTIKPEDQLSNNKLLLFRRVSEWYANKHKNVSKNGYQLDVICIDMSKNFHCISLRHYENI